MNLTALQRIASCRNPLAGFSVIGVLIALCIMASTVQCQTATYSDSYVTDNSPLTYDAENDVWIYPEELGAPNLVVGVGVTEADYSSYSESVTTTLFGPDGMSVSNVSYDTPSARVEVTLAPVNDGNEYEYDVQTVHRYWVDDHILAALPNCGSDKRCIRQAAYRGARPLGFFEVFTEALLTSRTARSTYHFSRAVPAGPILKLCVMHKICGNCGQSLAGVFIGIFQDCPEYLGTEFVRFTIPFYGGAYCQPAGYQIGAYYNCN